MELNMLTIYGQNFIFTLLKAIVYTVSCFVAFYAFDLMDTKTDIRKELNENHNTGWAIIIGSLILGLAYVIGQI